MVPNYLLVIFRLGSCLNVWDLADRYDKGKRRRVNKQIGKNYKYLYVARPVTHKKMHNRVIYKKFISPVDIHGQCGNKIQYLEMYFICMWSSACMLTAIAMTLYCWIHSRGSRKLTVCPFSFLLFLQTLHWLSRVWKTMTIYKGWQIYIYVIPRFLLHHEFI